MSDKSRLESAEKLLVSHQRLLKKLFEKIDELEEEQLRLGDQIQQVQDDQGELEDKVDSRFNRHEPKQFFTDPNPKV